MSLPTQLAFLN